MIEALAMTNDSSDSRSDKAFWSDVFALHGSVTPIIFGRVIWFGAIAAVYTAINAWIHTDLGIGLGPVELAGGVLGFLLVFRTNAGYDRWYEGRKLMGQIVNHSRNLAITTLAHGPEDARWRESVIRWIASFGHVTRATLRRQKAPSAVRELLGQQWTDELDQAPHMPTAVALRIGEFMQHACTEMGMSQLGFLEADRERAWLIEYEGACERIRSTPIPIAYSINIRRLSFLYLALVPFALLDHLRTVEWLSPLIMMLIAYPILAMDQIGVELEHPFDNTSLNHLPLDELCGRIESELLGLLAASPSASPAHKPE
ncbi:MAG TPA: bestrophin family ion channel [Pirellulales bacterium]|nr:bestrophin family ion channel [Pirellulales bacterium]